MPLRDRLALFALGSAAAYALYRQSKKIDALLETQQAQYDALLHALQMEGRAISRQSQMLGWLEGQIDLVAPLPPMRGYAISPDFGVLLVRQLRARKPKLVVELGCGVSTILCGYVLREWGGRLVGVEALDTYVDEVRETVADHGLTDHVEIIHAPLAPLELDGRRWQWYDTAALAHLKDIDLLTIDGPSQYNNPLRMARYPALPFFEARLCERAAVLLDDTHRDDERWIVERYLREFNAFRKVGDYHQFEKGAVLLER